MPWSENRAKPTKRCTVCYKTTVNETSPPLGVRTVQYVFVVKIVSSSLTTKPISNTKKCKFLKIKGKKIKVNVESP
jgi:hypothetical protein